MTGTLTDHFQTMSQLVSLNLKRNPFEGTLDDILNCGNCTETLKGFYSRTGLSGSIPERLFKFSNLIEFQVAASGLTGTIPSGFGQLTTLQSLDLQQNFDFAKDNALPSEIGKMTNLRTLQLARSTIGGTIPSELQYLVNLKTLDVSHTQQNGSIAMEICNIDSLDKICHSSGVNCSCLNTDICVEKNDI